MGHRPSCWWCSILAKFQEALEFVLLMAMHKMMPLGLHVSWPKIKSTVNHVEACGEDIEVLENFTYSGRLVQHREGSHREVFRRAGLNKTFVVNIGADGRRSGSPSHLCSLNYGCGVWPLNSDLEGRIRYFGSKSLRWTTGASSQVWPCIISAIIKGDSIKV